MSRVPKKLPVKGKRTARVEAPEQPDELEGMSATELTELIERATEMRDSKIGTARREFVDRVRSEAAGLGISMDELTSGKMKVDGRSRKPAAIKYQGPGLDDTWTGRGRPPRWLSALEAQGKNREKYLVKKS